MRLTSPARLSLTEIETARAMRTLLRVVAIATAMALVWSASGCGGGGSSAGGAGAGGGPGAGSGADDVAIEGGSGSPCAGDAGAPECLAVTLINVERASQMPPLPPLRWSAALALAAARHNAWMVENACFAHVCAGEPDVGARLRAAGYDHAAYGETIGAGYGSAQAMVDGWMSSPGHRAILLGDFEEVGLALLECPGSCAYGTYWSADFGTAR